MTATRMLCTTYEPTADARPVAAKFARGHLSQIFSDAGQSAQVVHWGITSELFSVHQTCLQRRAKVV